MQGNRVQIPVRSLVRGAWNYRPPVSAFQIGLGVQRANLVSELDLDAASALGFEVFRFTCADLLTPDLERADRLIEAMWARGITPMAIIGSIQLGSLPRNNATWKLLADRAGMLAERYADGPVIWEIWNEPNHDKFWNRPNPAHYAEAAVQIARAIRDAAPAHQVIGPAIATGRLSGARFLEDVLKSRPELVDLLDAISIHGYQPTGREAPEQLVATYARTRDILRPFRRDMPIVLSEMGWTTGGGAAISPQEQAMNAARMLLLHDVVGSSGSILYQMRDEVPSRVGDRYGLLSVDAQPRPAYATVGRMFQELEGYRFTGISVQGSSYFITVYQNEADGAWKAAAWRTDGRSRDLVLPMPGGQRIILPRVGPFPTYHSLPAGTMEPLSASLKRATL
jgi:hypothetical protein